MKTLVFVLAIIASETFALKCKTFDMQYKFCYEDWVPEKMAGTIAQLLDAATITTDMNLVKSVKADTTALAFQIRSSEMVKELAQLPYEMRNDAMEETLGQKFGAIFYASMYPYFQAEKDRGSIKDTSATGYFTWLLSLKYEVDLMSDKGRLAKAYNMSDYVKNWMAKSLEEKIQVQTSEE